MIRKTKTYEESAWEGACPKCGKKQRSVVTYEVDKLCDECVEECAHKEFAERSECLMGANIIDIHEGKRDNDKYKHILSIVFTTSDNRRFKISGEEWSEDDPHLVLKEIFTHLDESEHPVAKPRGWMMVEYTLAHGG